MNEEGFRQETVWQRAHDRARRSTPSRAGLSSPTVSVVIPTLNEADNLRHVLPYIPRWVDEVLLIDGLSTDGTVRVARELRPDVRIVHQLGRGRGAALRSGFAVASGDILIMLDADGSMDPGEIPAFVGALLAGADLARGSRFLQGGGTSDIPAYRQFGTRCLLMLVRLLFGSRYSDLCYGYNAFWRQVLPLLDLDGDGLEIETLMSIRALRAGLKIVEVPSFGARRISGEGHVRAFPRGWRVLKTILREGYGRIGAKAKSVRRSERRSTALQGPVLIAEDRMVREELPGVVALPNDEQHGLSGVCNSGARGAPAACRLRLVPPALPHR